MDQQNKRNKPAKLYFEEYTPGDCDSSLPPIIFMHGIGSLHSSWSTVSKQIAHETGRKVISIDLRNHGKSEFNDYFSVELLVLDLDNFLTENGIKRCVLIGHSMGGRACLYFALKKPEFVECVVAEETALQNLDDEQLAVVKKLTSLLEKVKFLPKSITVFEGKKLLRDLIAAKFPGRGIECMAYFMPLRQNPDGSFDLDLNYPVLSRSLDDFSNYVMTLEPYCKFHERALFIYAENSEAKVEEDELIAERFPKAELYKFNSPGHVLHIECSQEFIKKVSAFIRN